MLQECKYSDISISPQELIFRVQEGSEFIPPYQYVVLEKVTASGLPANWTAAVDADWVLLNIRSGTVPGRIRVGVRSVGMATGVYFAKLTIRSHVVVLPSPTISITLEVKATEPPAPPEPEPPEPEPPEPEPPEPEPPVEPPAPPEPPGCWLPGWPLQLFRKVFRIKRRP